MKIPPEITGKIIDFHTHVFPDQLAKQAIPLLEKTGNIKAYSDGTTKGLIQSMDNAGIEASVVCSIATRPEQFDSILSFSSQIISKRVIPLPSIHPDYENPYKAVETIAKMGFPGIKMHPFYQNFYLTDKKLNKIFDSLSSNNLLLVIHNGYDIAFPRERRVDPDSIIQITEKFPELKLINTHLGGWKMWDEVEQKLIGRPLHMEISLALQFLSASQVKRMLLNHPEDFLLFGSDTPWEDQLKALSRLRALDLNARIEKKILSTNAQKLLGLAS